jgi:hypothetical protein
MGVVNRWSSRCANGVVGVVGVGVAVVLSVACGAELDVSDADDALVLDPTAVLDQGVIVGELDWVEANLWPDGPVRTAARAAGYVSIPSRRARCSGFLVARDVVMTNHHCVPDEASAQGVVMNFLYESATWNSAGAVRCERFLGANEALDYALLGCAGAPGDTFGVLSIDDRVVAPNHAIALLHQQCDFYAGAACVPTKKVSPGSITRLTANRVIHNADMLGGSSGGAIVDATTGAVVAINNAHVVTGTTGGRGTTNLGVPMSLVAADIRARFPSALADDCEAIGSDGRDLNEDDACVTLGGNAHHWRAMSDAGFDGDLAWTGTTSSQATANFAQWRLKVAAAGEYELSVYVDGGVSGTVSGARWTPAARARYVVTHAGGSTAVVVNQGAAAGVGGFIPLGRFSLTPGAAHRVVVADNTGDRGQHLMVDALRVRAVPPPTTTRPETETETETPPPATATCSAVRVSGAASLNVRPQPNTSRSPVGVLREGDVVTRVETVTGQVVRGDTRWYRITSPALSGFISASYATCVE